MTGLRPGTYLSARIHINCGYVQLSLRFNMAITADTRIDEGTRAQGESLLARFFETMTSLQAEKAAGEIPSHLRALDETTLRSFGYNEAQLRAIRNQGL
jgi:hypothetical protein